MSKTVDERVVEMRFDNQQFESGVKTTMSTLDKFKSSLKMDGLANGLNDVNKAAKGFSLNPISSAVDTVKNNFSALEIAGITALVNITNSAVNAGKQLVKSLTLDQVKAGFSEYELKMGSVQTIMASTGADIKTVNGYLNELNHYADKTIYSFSDMTSNIGKFTNAGVKLEDAVAAIKGISNEAAVSGANTNEASRAMYNFAQALSAGYVKLIDWKSIENANMATVEFKQSLLDTAVALGTVTKEGDKYISTTTDAKGKTSEAFNATSMFNDSLANQWMTTDVLVQTLNNYSTDVREMSEAEKKAYEEKLKAIGYTEEEIKKVEELGIKATDAATEVKTFSMMMDALKEAAGSGWAQTFEILFGNLEEAKKLWTSVNNVVGGFLDRTSDARNNLLQAWKNMGGRVLVIDALKHAFEGLVSILKPIGDAWKDIFPPTTAKRLYYLSAALNSFMMGLKLTDKDSENLKNTFKGLFSILDIVKQAFGAFIKLLFPAAKSVGDLASSILEFTGNVGKEISDFNNFLKKEKAFDIFVDKAKNAFDGLYSKIENPIRKIKILIKSFFASFTGDSFVKLDHQLTLLLAPQWFRDLASTLHSCGSKIKSAIDGIKAAFKSLFGIGSSGGPSGGGGGGPKSMAGQMTEMANATGMASKAVEAFKSIMSNTFEALKNSNLGELLSSLSGYIIKFAAVLGGLKIAGSISDYVGALTSIVKMPVTSITSITKGISKVLSSVSDTFEEFQKQFKVNNLLKITLCIGGLTIALIALSGIPVDQLATSLATVAGMFVILSKTASYFGDNDIFDKFGKNSKSGIVALGSFVIMIDVLASAVSKIGKLKPLQAAAGLVAVYALIEEMKKVMTELSSVETKPIKTGGLIAFALAIDILASAIKKVSKLEPLKAAVGLVAVYMLIEEMKRVMVTISDSKISIKGGVGLLAFGLVIDILASTMKKISELEPLKAAVGLVAVYALIEEMKLVLVAISDLHVGVGTLAGMLAFAGTIVIMANTLKDLSTVPWASLLASAASLGIVVAAMVATMKLTQGAGSGALSLLAMAAAVRVMAVALSVLGKLGLPAIGSALLALAGGFVVIGAAAAILAPLTPALLAMAAAFSIVGAGCMAIGAGLLLFASAMIKVAAISSASALAITAALQLMFVGVIKMITTNAKLIADAIQVIIKAIIDAIVNSAKQIAEGFFTCIEQTLQLLVQYAPRLITMAMDFIKEILTGLTERIPEIVDLTVDFFNTLFTAISAAIKNVDTSALLDSIKAIGILDAIMAALAVGAVLAPAAMIGVVAMGAVVTALAAVLTSIGMLALIPGLQFLMGEGGNMLQTVGTTIGQFVGGIVGGFAAGMSAQFPQIASDLSMFMTNLAPFIEGASKIDASTMDGAQSLAKVILTLTAANILEGLTSWFTGGTSLAAFGEELEAFGPHIANYAASVQGVNPEVVQASASAAKILADMASTLPNSGGLAGKIMGENSLAAFGAELEKFGPSISAYAATVKGVDPAAVTGSVQAAQMIADMAKTLPNSGGVVSWFTGDNTLSKFGTELTAFGAPIASYAEQVKDVNATAVKGSVDAAKMIADMSTKLPNQGGIVTWFTGDNKISKFGKELEKFGPHIKAYSDSIKDIDAGAVNASANAAKSLTAFANAVPNKGGLAAIFTGENSIAAFGKQLNKFGKEFNEYGQSISGLDTDAITASTAALKSIVDMAISLNGVDTSVLDNFSTNLSSIASSGVDEFVKAFEDAGEQATKAVTDMLTKVSNSLNNTSGKSKNTKNVGTSIAKGIVDGINSKKGDAVKAINTMCTGIVNAAKTGLSSESFNKVGQNVVTGIANGMNNNKASVSTAVNSIAMSIKNGFTKNLNTANMSTLGGSVVQAIVNGINGKKPALTTAVAGIKTTLNNAFKTGLDSNAFAQAGNNVVNALCNALTSKASSVTKAGKALVGAAANQEVKNFAKSGMNQCGEYAMAGMVAGIKSKQTAVKNAVKQVCSGAVKQVKIELGIKSPSRVFKQIGKYMDEGMILGIQAEADQVAKESSALGQGAINSMRNAIQHASDVIDSDMNVEPTIRPVLDLTDVSDGVGKINSMLDTSATYKTASRASLSRYSSNNTIDGAVSSSSGPATITQNFTQNNYSPKALSQIDIYRQTKNQFAMMKGVVSAI